MAGDGGADESWLSARAALELVGTLFARDDDARKPIIEWCAHGIVATRCSHYVREDGHRTTPLATHAPALKAFWVLFQDVRNRETELWAVGSFAIEIVSAARYQSAYHRAFGVEFLETELRQAAGLEMAPVSKRKPRTSRPDDGSPPKKINPKVLNPWIADFGARNPSAPFATILREARAAFPQFRVAEIPVKRAIADLGLKLSAGNPRTLRK